MQYKEGCWYSTKIGLLLSDGTYLLQPGEEVAAHIKGSLVDTAILKPTPNPTVFLDLEPDKATGSGYYVRFRTLESLQFTRTRHVTGAVTLEYTQPITAKIERAKSTGTEYMNVQDQYVWYSTDAQYMLLWTERGVLYVYNLNDFTVLPVYIRSKPTGTLKGGAAISDSGRYVAVSIESKTYGDLYVADLDTCNQKPAKIISAAIATCGVQSQKSLMSGAIKDFSFPSIPRFFDDHTLGFYHVVEPPESILPDIHTQPSGPAITTDIWALFTIQASGTTRVTNKYIALGDSFSSGEGAGNYDLGTDRPGVNMCHTSKKSYPYVLNNRLNLTDFHSVACSGAIIEDVYDNDYEVPVDINLSLYTPGETLQIEHAKHFRPDIVTVTISGNDIHFSDRLKYCILSSPNCYSSYSKRKEITTEILRQHDRLVELYEEILDTGIETRLYVSGYPQIVNSSIDASCASNVQLNAYQRIMADDLINYFNAVIQHAAQQAGAFYVGTETALNGHRMCDGASALIGVNGITIGGQTGTIESLSKGMYHPNELGHELLANAIFAETDGLSKPMPATMKFSATPPQPEDYPFLGVAPDGVPPADLYYAHLADTTTVQDTMSADYESADYDIPVAPYSEYEASLRSDPITLGTLSSDGAGNIKGTFTIPDSVKPGMHEFHLRGPGLDGKPIDLYQFVYVAASDVDFDGDGTPNAAELCGIIEPSGNDIDNDAIDDGCDGTIIPPTPQDPEPAATPEEDLSYKTNGSSPETNPPLEIESEQQTALDDRVSPAIAVITASQSSLPAATPSVQQPLTTNVPGVLSASETSETDSSTQTSYAAPERESTGGTENSLFHTWFIPVSVIGFTTLLVISYSIYKHGKNKKITKKS